MSSFANNQPSPAKPDSVAIGELAIAASAAGYPMTVMYRYFGADVLGALWHRHLQDVGPNRGLHVRCERHLRQIETLVEQLDLILVSRPRLYMPVVWTVLLRAQGTLARPAIFCQFADRDPDDDPGATVVIHGRHGEPEKISHYLAKHRSSALRPLASRIIESVSFDPIMLDMVHASLPRQRDRNIVRSLLAGECILRSAASCEPARWWA